MIKFISSNNFIKLLDVLTKDYNVYVPVKKGEKRFYKKYDSPDNDIVVGEVRAFEPLKAFFSPAREVLAEAFSAAIPPSTDKPFCIVGVKVCDLKGLKIHDYVFKNHDYTDTLYTKMREEGNTTPAIAFSNNLPSSSGSSLPEVWIGTLLIVFSGKVLPDNILSRCLKGLNIARGKRFFISPTISAQAEQ